MAVPKIEVEARGLAFFADGPTRDVTFRGTTYTVETVIVRPDYLQESSVKVVDETGTGKVNFTVDTDET